jgi:hypothetical protein
MKTKTVKITLEGFGSYLGARYLRTTEDKLGVQE